jgi:hypothetical protein
MREGRCLSNNGWTNPEVLFATLLKWLVMSAPRAGLRPARPPEGGK